ncbi:UNVERIFIED_CONTAM: hypothetical protein HDU68_012255 [Siphonaria sp. JEL0065]|nr:hypothetical protein HDU68_012255 [Siphonaria sp. JEL0065]
MKGLIRFDGASKGNPGPSAAGAVVYSLDRVVELAQGGNGHPILLESGFKLPDEATNNQAEYHALILALKRAAKLEFTEVLCEVTTRKMTGENKIKSESLMILNQDAWEIINSSSFKDHIAFRHISWQDNHDADRVANEALQLERKIYRKCKKTSTSEALLEDEMTFNHQGFVFPDEDEEEAFPLDSVPFKVTNHHSVHLPREDTLSQVAMSSFDFLGSMQ